MMFTNFLAAWKLEWCSLGAVMGSPVFSCEDLKCKVLTSSSTEPYMIFTNFLCRLPLLLGVRSCCNDSYGWSSFKCLALVTL
ncbi:hypothetical protein KC19_7G018600 [Ceratodon purpureus]|uniref:Secreted protein n=1 Tax=Ceratodon purpureus TaxID=3225 RepID=A0A8T0H3H1_CERPU|nr:hypothetical protein KC19_7G018600 [Ceratodon purpureus]